MATVTLDGPIEQIVEGLYKIKWNRSVNVSVIMTSFTQSAGESLTFNFLLSNEEIDKTPSPDNRYYICVQNSDSTITPFSIILNSSGNFCLPVPSVESANFLYVQISGLLGGTILHMAVDYNRGYL